MLAGQSWWEDNGICSAGVEVDAPVHVGTIGTCTAPDCSKSAALSHADNESSPHAAAELSRCITLHLLNKGTAMIVICQLTRYYMHKVWMLCDTVLSLSLQGSYAIKHAWALCN
jgi:hypothetical protein